MIKKRLIGTTTSPRIHQRVIAERAGVSISTVSRVLNNIPGISDELKRHVLETAVELGYQLPGPQSALREISLYTTNLSSASASLDTFNTSVLAGVEEECRRHDIQLRYTVVEQSSVGSARILDALEERPADGVILVSMDDRAVVEKAQAFGLRVVVVNAEHPPLVVDTFVPDNYGGPLLAMRHLIANGHRHILHMTHLQRPTMRRRYEGYRAALEEAQIAFDPALLINQHMELDDAYAVVTQLLGARRTQFSAIFCANDVIAIGALRALHDCGLRVPDDISLIGYDDIPTVEFLTPPLTTVRTERMELGELAVRRLIERAANPTLTPVRVELASRLVLRQSVAPARATTLD